VGTAAEFFRDYQAANPDPGKAVAPEKPNADDEQTRDIAPPRSGGSQNPQTPNVKLIKESDINKFYRDMAQAKADGVYLGREAQFRKREAEIEAAVREGRVVVK
jgi:hypothetical protein